MTECKHPVAQPGQECSDCDMTAQLQKLAQMDDGDIDFSDCPPATEAQLKRAGSGPLAISAMIKKQKRWYNRAIRWGKWQWSKYNPVAAYAMAKQAREAHCLLDNYLGRWDRTGKIELTVAQRITKHDNGREGACG